MSEVRCLRYGNLEVGLKDMEDMARNVKSDEELFKLSEQTSMFDVEFKLKTYEVLLYVFNLRDLARPLCGPR